MPAKNYETMAKILKGAITGSLESGGLTTKQQATLKKKIPSLSDLQEELEEINHEFKKFHIDKDKYLVARTGDAIAGGKNFGPFEIRLELIPTYHYYNTPRLRWHVHHSIKALKPRIPLFERLQRMTGAHRFDCDECYTHPHISGDRLCTGQRGSKAIHRAAQAFRIADIFFLLNSVLNGYSEHGAHVTLNEWKTVECSNCYTRKGIRGLYCCVNCGEVYCKKCIDLTCSVKGCKAGICKRCAPYNGTKAKCKIHHKVIGGPQYKKPHIKKATREKKDKFNGTRGWSL